MILLKNRDRNPSFKKGEYVEINDAGNYPMELSVDGVCEQETTSIDNGDEYDSPSPDYPQEIKTIENSLKITSCNKNLFGTEWEKYARNNTDGTSTVYSDNYIRTKNPILVKPNNMYSFKLETEKVIQGGDIHYYDINKNFIGRDSIGTIFTKTIPNNCHYINIQLYCNIGIIPSDINITQLEKGSTATPYEQHLETQIQANLPEGEFIGKIGDIKDTLNIVYKDDGHYHLILNKMIGKVVLDGSENWTLSSLGFILGTGEVYKHFKNRNINIFDGFCNYFVVEKSSVTWTKINYCGWNIQGVFWIRDDHKLASTTVDFKSWLSTHNTEVYYPLATPYVVDLGIVDALLTYDEITNIFTDSDLYPVINAKYYKDFKFDKILRSGYNIDEQEYEIAKKQMANGKRKRILSSYVDCIIKINLGLLDNKTYQEYKEHLDDGEFHYWSYKYNQYKKANFILTKPSITTEYAYDDDIGINDMEITLEKSSDIE